MTTDARRQPATAQDLFARFIGGGGSIASVKHRQGVTVAFQRAFTDLKRWADAPLPDKLAAPVDVRSFVAWAVLAGPFPAGTDYVSVVRSDWGHHARHAYPAFAETFATAASGLGFTPAETRRQWGVLAKIAAAVGTAPNELNETTSIETATALTAGRTDTGGKITNAWSTPLYGLKATLASLGLLTEARPSRISVSSRSSHWQELAGDAPQLCATMRRYLAQIGISMRPGSVALIDTTLRQFTSYLGTHNITTAAGIRRAHIEGFKTYLVSKAGYRGARQPAKATTGMRLGHLRCFFDRIIEWGYTDAPDRNPVFSGDMPIRDRPLPRFLSDPDAAALLSVARGLPGLFDRVTVEVLARTALRKGEYLGLTRDCITTIGDGVWLRTPVGKLHTDRYIPCHPRVKELLGQWATANPPLPHSPLMFTDRGRPIPGRRVDLAVQAAAAGAGIGHVTPHQLRHTLATQAINRGMSLEAIAALLGHSSLAMTMTYARIADRTAAEEYFAVTDKVEALYTPATPLPADAEGPNMRRLRAESTRLLGNGLCTRPAALDCRYETVCETCAHFAPTKEYRNVIQAQQQDAAQRNEPRREKVYLQLLNRLDTPKT